MELMDNICHSMIVEGEWAQKYNVEGRRRRREEKRMGGVIKEIGNMV